MAAQLPPLKLGTPTFNRQGLLCSALGHVLLLLLGIAGVFGGADFGPPEVYSVTLEGGSSLGGISQVPKKDNKDRVTPPKNVSEKKKIEEKIETALVEKKQREEKEKPAVKDAEVSTAEATPPPPRPTVLPRPTTAPIPTTIPKATEVPKKDEKKEKEKEKNEEKKEKEKKEDAKKQQADADKQYQQALQRYMGESADAGNKGFGAAKIGGKGMGGGEIRPPEFFTYRDLIKRTVKKNWTWYDTSTSMRATIVFKISKEGVISVVSIDTSSGNSEFDRSVERAVLKSSPLSPPPDNVYKYFESIRMEFDPLD